MNPFATEERRALHEAAAVRLVTGEGGGATGIMTEIIAKTTGL